MRIKGNVEIDKFVKNKLLWLENNNIHSDSTKQAYLDFIVLYAHPVEVFKDKDLYRFTPSDIKEMFKNLPKLKERNASTLWSAVNNYLSWASQRGLCPQGNPCDGINFADVVDVNVEAMKNSYVKLNYFWDKIRQYEYKDKIKYKYLIIAVLYRYGIPNKYIPYIKYSDIDTENKTISVYNKNRENIVMLLPIDDDFINFCEKVCDETGEVFILENNLKNSSYIVAGLNNKTISTNTTYSRYGLIFTLSKDNRMVINNLLNSRKYDMLYDIYNKKGMLTTEDINDIYVRFEGKSPTSGGFYLKDDFQIISGIHVYTQKEMDKLR